MAEASEQLRKEIMNESLRKSEKGKELGKNASLVRKHLLPVFRTWK